MSKKKKPTSHKAKQGHPARAGAAGHIISIDEFRARTGGDQVAAGFMKWVRANTSLPELGDPLPVLREFLENYLVAAKTQVATELHPFATRVALGKYFFDHPEEDFGFVLQVVMGYLLYLDDSDLWSGSDRLFDEVQEELLETADEQTEAELDDRVFEVPALSRAKTRDALLALPLAAHLQAFFVWFGDKRDVTSTGLLTRKDIEGASAALGVAARGVGAISDDADLYEDAPFQATSAQQIPQLDLFWEALVRIGIIEVGSRRATMNRPLDSLSGAAREDMLMHLVRDVALSLYMQFIATAAGLEDDEDPEDTDLFGDLVSSVLLDSGIDEGIEAKELAVALATLEDGGLAEVPLTQLALDLMVEEGLLERDTHLRVPSVLKKLVAFAVAEPAGLEVSYEDPEDEDLAYLGAED
ncbi:hypothetical protein GCM10009715_36430 [Paeniglutamicibacter psychrophenolicus]|uniref:Uncharacterized protein n=1 Tax=Paeniglutamicibacter psychrophenolicus TaxID=257454 RepID=A0ABS4WAJ3_9MICC|nr:hypothetical protein [Paeniglutamicibacter psychrophenolicus]MBP2373229.1 hypothetical protein [Paeniglutamicibacter psychrophenolicus]